MNLKTIDTARQLLTDHSEGDFVSKANAKECADQLSQLMTIIAPKTQLIIDYIMAEVERAELKHPNWPNDKVYAATIVAEENGELTRACLQYQLEGGNIEEVEKEAIQTAATCIRLLKNI